MVRKGKIVTDASWTVLQRMESHWGTGMGVSRPGDCAIGAGQDFLGDIPMISHSVGEAFACSSPLVMFLVKLASTLWYWIAAKRT